MNELDIIEYWLLLRDAVVYNYMHTEDGRKYLEDCWRIEQTNPDRKALRKKVGRKEVQDG